MDLPFTEPGGSERRRPLADRMRPGSLGDLVGQEQIGIGEWIGSMLVLSGVTLGLRPRNARS